MKKTLFYALAAATALAGAAETTPASAANVQTSPTLEQIRAEALTSLSSGELQNVRHTRSHRAQRRKYRPRRWCGYKRYYGRRCYYTPRVLRPFRQG